MEDVKTGLGGGKSKGRPVTVWTRRAPGLSAVLELRGAEERADPAPAARSCAPCFGGVGSEWSSIKGLKSRVAGEERGEGVARFPPAALKFFPSSEEGRHWAAAGWPGPSYARVVAWCVRQGSVPPTPSKGKSAWTSVKAKTPNSDGPVQKSYFKIGFLCSLTKKKPPTQSTPSP